MAGYFCARIGLGLAALAVGACAPVAHETALLPAPTSLTSNATTSDLPQRPVASVPDAPAPPFPSPPLPVGPFLIFFDWAKADINADAAATLDNAAAAYAQGGHASVILTGFADKSGNGAYNVALSQRRVDAVKAYLLGRGIAAAVITTTVSGERKQLIPTADGVREPQNRRVEITFGPSSAP